MLRFTRKLIQAPLAGYSCAPLRKLAWQWGKPDFCCSEMLSAKHIYLGAPQKRRYRYKSPEEGSLCIQLAGNNADVLAYAAEQVVSWGADLIDLNCGCPQPKIRKKHYGSQLLADSKQLASLLKALKSVVDLPVLVKIRVDNQSTDQYNYDVAKAVEDADIDAITVHGRNWRERYDTPVSLADIAEIKQLVNIPVIGNGDVCNTASAKKMFAETGCDAVMIARASVGQPWLFEQIHEELQGNQFIPPTIEQIAAMFLQHINELVELECEKVAVLQARKLGKYYARDRVTPEFLTTLYQAESLLEIIAAVDNNFIKS